MTINTAAGIKCIRYFNNFSIVFSYQSTIDLTDDLNIKADVSFHLHTIHHGYMTNPNYTA